MNNGKRRWLILLTSLILLGVGGYSAKATLGGPGTFSSVFTIGAFAMNAAPLFGIILFSAIISRRKLSLYIGSGSSIFYFFWWLLGISLHRAGTVGAWAGIFVAGIAIACLVAYIFSFLWSLFPRMRAFQERVDNVPRRYLALWVMVPITLSYFSVIAVSDWSLDLALYRYIPEWMNTGIWLVLELICIVILPILGVRAIRHAAAQNQAPVASNKLFHLQDFIIPVVLMLVVLFMYVASEPSYQKCYERFWLSPSTGVLC